MMTASIQVFERERQDKLLKPRPAIPKPKLIMVISNKRATTWVASKTAPNNVFPELSAVTDIG